MTYKDVFELAESKGYACWYDENIITNDTTSKQKYIEMSLIQKWLRDTHKIHVQPDNLGSDLYRVSVSNSPHFWIYTDTQKKNNPTSYNSYEEALLEGINEALQLI